MKNKINKQIYYLIVFIIYRISNIFHVSFLKLYSFRADDQETKVMMQVSKFINDIEQ